MRKHSRFDQIYRITCTTLKSCPSMMYTFTPIPFTLGSYTFYSGVLYPLLWGCIPFTLGPGAISCLLWGHIPFTLGVYTLCSGVLYPLLWCPIPVTLGCIPFTLGPYTVYYGVIYPLLWGHIPLTLGPYTLYSGLVYPLLCGPIRATHQTYILHSRVLYFPLRDVYPLLWGLMPSTQGRKPFT